MGRALLTGFCGLLIGCEPLEFSEIRRFEIPQGAGFVVVEAAHSRLAYGPETLRMYVEGAAGAGPTVVVTTRISNDGGGVNSENLQGEWVSAHLIRFCLTGVEQADRILELDVEKLSYVEETKECGGL